MCYRIKILQAILFSLGVGFLLSCLVTRGVILILLGIICIALSLVMTKIHL